MALGFLATTGRADEITLCLPTELARPLDDALGHLRDAATGERAVAFDGLARQAGTGELKAPRETLRELVAVAIDDAGERVGGAGARLLRGDEAAAGELRAAVAELGALLDLLESVSR